MIIPYQVDVPMYRWPIANYALIVVTFIISIIGLEGLYNEADWAFAMVLNGWSLSGLFGHMFLHAGIIHLLGNLLFLWVFGNAVCAKIGNAWFPLVYLILGLLAATTHNIVDGSPAIGASGAINGVVGMFLVLYPLNCISCFWLGGILWGSMTFAISSYWMILFWFVFDIWGAVGEDAGVASWAHIGGLLGGVAVAIILLQTGLIEMDDRERSLVEVLRGR